MMDTQSIRVLVKAVALSTVLCATNTVLGGVAVFKPMGFLPDGTYSTAKGISPNGLVVVGQADTLGAAGGPLIQVNRAIRWEAGNMQSLGSLTFDPISAVGWDASEDGSVIVGTEFVPVGLGAAPLGWRWENGIMTQLPFAPGGDDHSARAVSYDGRTIVGQGDVGANFDSALRWVAGVVQNMGTGTGDNNDLAGNYGVSANGQVSAGSSDFGGNDFFAYRHDGAFHSLGSLGLFASNGRDVSGDGQVVVGLYSSPVTAFRWESNVMVSLGDLPGGADHSEANATNHDGSVVVGRGTTASGDEAFIWTQADGMQNLKTVLEGAGLDLTGWTLTEATGISADGMTIVGNGVNPNGDTEGWVAIVREPSTLGMLVLSLAAMTCRRR